jgi:formylglycine-generating enzyme required for sulfatase activity
MPARPPLELKIDDQLSLKCIWIASGKFFMGSPYYQFVRWQEEPPHMVTLTKPYFIAEIPVTQEIYGAVMGKNPSEFKDPKFPVSGIYDAEMYQFCAALSKRTGRNVRLPTAAEWEYAARAGTSNPTFAVKHADQSNPGGDAYSGKPGPVKAKRPNAWGLYDLCCNSWELVSDEPILDRDAVVDPQHLPRVNRQSDRLPDHVGKGGQNYPISEIEYLHPPDGKIIRFRVVVEATEEETASLKPAQSQAVSK